LILRIAKDAVAMNKCFSLRLPVVGLCALVGLTAAVRGQAPDAAAQLETLAKQLELTPEQKGKLLPILKVEVPKVQAIKNDQSISGFQKLRQLRAIHNESAPQLEKILSPDQYKKLQGIREQAIKDAIEKQKAGG
jgi:hypothetical protein